jgi:hypothetical protein
LNGGGEVVGGEAFVAFANPPDLVDALRQTLSQLSACGARLRPEILKGEIELLSRVSRAECGAK